jgi:hypothetical protein
VGGVEVVDAVGQGVVDHLVHPLFVNGGGIGLTGEQGQAHSAKAQPGELDAVEIVGHHGGFPPQNIVYQNYIGLRGRWQAPIRSGRKSRMMEVL